LFFLSVLPAKTKSGKGEATKTNAEGEAKCEKLPNMAPRV